MKQKLFLTFFFTLYSIAVVYAIDTVIQNIVGGQTAIKSNSYQSQTIQTLRSGDLRFINSGNDQNRVGDYFSGYYYDSAYGLFRTDTTGSKVAVSSNSVALCPTTHTGNKLIGSAYSQDFGFINFNRDATTYVYICIPIDAQNKTLRTYLGGYAYSPYIGFQNFDGIFLDSSVDIGEDNLSEGRLVKITGITASGKNTEALEGQLSDDVRIIGKFNKAEFRRDLESKIYGFLHSIPDSKTLGNSAVVSGADSAAWISGSNGGTKTLEGRVVVYKGLSGQNVSLDEVDDVEGNKTLIVEGGNIYINKNIRNTDGDGILGLMALEKDGKGGNIYIDPSVSDIHAVMYARKSVLSYNVTAGEYDGDIRAEVLKNQLYIHGSVLSENTIGGAEDVKCPYFVPEGTCTLPIAQKYDFNFIRKYILVQPIDAEGNPVGVKSPQYDGIESYMGNSSNVDTETQKPGYRKHPFIIEYNPNLQIDPPPFFGTY